MRFFFWITIVLSVSASQRSGLTNVVNNFEREILENVEKGEFREAIISAAEYEQELISRYTPPTFQMDLFQSEADHLSFHSSFTDWKQVGLKELEIPEWVPMMGLNNLLTLKGKVEDDRFVILSMNVGQIEQRMGLSEPGRTRLSDQELLSYSVSMAGDFGVVKKQEFKTIGDHHALVLDIGTPMGGPPITLVSLVHGKRLYGFLLMSSLGNRQHNERRLFELIKTVDFKYKPADEAKIKMIRGKFAGKDEPLAILQCINQLAAIGEYNAAAEQLARLRIFLNQHMPKPFIEGNVARNPVYGVSLANPDDKKWKLSIVDAGAMNMLLLEDKWSVKGEGMAILILDTILTYGPQAAKAIRDEEEEKGFLIGAGRGGALSIGTAIENERFTTMKGSLAYEATVATNFPGVKAKCVFILRSGSMLGFLMMADANTFQEKIEEYERIIQGDWLQIDD